MEINPPKIDHKAIQVKSEEFALKGAIDTIKDFYTGYGSPYKKAIKKSLEHKGFNSSLELPDVVACINDALTKEIDKIANTAVAKTFVPLVTQFLTRADKEIKLSDILKEFINYCGYQYNDSEDPSDYSYEFYDSYEDEPDDYVLKGSWFIVEIASSEKSFELRFYKKDKKEDVYELSGLPSEYKTKGMSQTMKLSLEDGATLEMPFVHGVLHDGFISYLARLLMAETKITLDVDGFEEWMFPENHCHC